MFHRHETTISWRVVPRDLPAAVEAGTHTEDGTPLGILTSTGINLERIFNEEQEKMIALGHDNSFLSILEPRITDLISERYPHVSKISLMISCRIMYRNEDQSGEQP